MRGRQGAVAADELGVVLAEHDFVVVRLDAADRLRAGGPDLAALRVAQEDEGAPVVAGRVLAPARDGDVAPAAVAGAGGRQHHRVAAVRQQMRHRRAAGGGVERGAPSARRVTASRGGGLHLLGARMRDGDVARHALLQQQLAGLDHRLAVEARAHPAVLQRVGDGDDGHALVVRHEVAHDRDVLALGQPRAGEVERLVEAVAAAAPMPARRA